jgi:hypothetical protein
MRNLYGMINATEAAYFENLRDFETRNHKLQCLGILQVRAEMLQTIQNRWEWFESLPSEFQENGLFVENLKDELRQEAQYLIQKQQEMGMDKTHLQQLEEMLEIG